MYVLWRTPKHAIKRLEFFYDFFIFSRQIKFSLYFIRKPKNAGQTIQFKTCAHLKKKSHLKITFKFLHNYRRMIFYIVLQKILY